MVWKFARRALHGSGRAHAAGTFLCTTGSGPRNAPQSQQNLPLRGYDRTRAAPSGLLIVQRRAPCLCNADPCASLMQVQFRSLVLTHWAHTTLFFQLLYQHNREQIDTKHGFRNLPVLNVVFLQIAIFMQNVHRAGGLIVHNSAAKHCIVSA